MGSSKVTFIHFSSPHEIEKDIMEQIMFLNYGDDGLMKEELLTWLEHEDKGIECDDITVFVLMKKRGRVVLSWSMASRFLSRVNYFCWTDERVRRMGFGTLLFHFAMDIIERNKLVLVHGENERSLSFYRGLLLTESANKHDIEIIT